MGVDARRDQDSGEDENDNGGQSPQRGQHPPPGPRHHMREPQRSEYGRKQRRQTGHTDT
jgi:hypothetical protein